MEYTLLGRSGIRVSRVALGCSRLGGTVERFDARESMDVLARAFDAGITLFDTADIYAQGHSERLLGEAFRGRRDRVVIATKGGYALAGTGSLLASLKPLLRPLVRRLPGLSRAAATARGSQMRQDFSRAHLTAALEASLRRLGTDYVDLYQLHSPSSAVLADADVFATLDILKRDGKIRAAGVSVLSSSDALTGVRAGVDVVQMEAHVLAPGGLEQVAPVAAEAKVTVVARQPFASGLLFRSPDTWTIEDVGGEASRLDAARAAAAHLATFGNPADVALRYLRHHGGAPVVLLATTRRDHLERNMRTLALPPFSDQDAARLRAGLPT